MVLFGVNTQLLYLDCIPCYNVIAMQLEFSIPYATLP